MMTEESPKDSGICHMSDSISSTKNDYGESEIDLVEVNAACLDHFFLEEDNLDE